MTDGRPFVKKSELGMLNNQYDIFVTGSDQVWNLECSGEDWSYFLDFAEDEKRNSYAASFGSSTAGITNKEQMKQLLRNYSHISVREESGYRIISELLGKRVPVVLDPVFLLEKEEWKELFDLSFEEKYVLVYEVLAGDKLFDQAKTYAKSKGLKVICITSTNRVRQGAKVVKSAGPIEWLRLFAGASYVFTNSFHGLAFSLIFEKQFFVELLPPPANTNARILELLDKVGLTGRDSSKSMKMEEIDYTAVNNVLRTEKDLSLNYLKSIIEGEN
ncbi:MAG: polysaccharide pyruvyl transferase family protein [Clostridiales bacterium]|nr:polysaccharide pyruvyl transferase family protein [Clostridiales bacterium]